MAQKKSFKAELSDTAITNPARMFISEPESNPEPEKKKVEKAETKAETPVKTVKAEIVDAATVSAYSKPSHIPEGYKVNTLLVETRSKRFQMLIQPSLYETLKMVADKEGCSVNDIIHRTLEEKYRA